VSGSPWVRRARNWGRGVVGAERVSWSGVATLSTPGFRTEVMTTTYAIRESYGVFYIAGKSPLRESNSPPEPCVCAHHSATPPLTGQSEVSTSTKPLRAASSNATPWC